MTVGFAGLVLRRGEYSFFSFPGPNIVNTFPVGLNRRGEMVGSFERNTVAEEHGFYRSRDGAFTRLDFPGAVQTEAFDISDDGDVIIGRYLDAHGINHGFILRNGVYNPFDYAAPDSAGPNTYIWTMNSENMIVGYSFGAGPYGPPANGFVAHVPAL